MPLLLHIPPIVAAMGSASCFCLLHRCFAFLCLLLQCVYASTVAGIRVFQFGRSLLIFVICSALQFRPSGEKKSVKEEELDTLKAMGSSSIEDAMDPPSYAHVKVLVSDMLSFMQVHAFGSAITTFDSLEQFSSKHISHNIKKLSKTEFCNMAMNNDAHEIDLELCTPNSLEDVDVEKFKLSLMKRIHDLRCDGADYLRCTQFLLRGKD
ncbi:hypothetical protein PIB30_069098 [Stylosanthes scabra]|uniref:Uncharacterized protein n=1 Tax=Stylosanthes scabra TaxID=79078 RepID=A0ABU6RNI2_9FABA|nr:hypothetical protein [Stylosanthes scabra]